MPKSFLVTLIIYLPSGQTKKVDWVEKNLMKVEGGDVKRKTPVTDVGDVESFFNHRFVEWMDKGKTIVRKNIKGEFSVIPFSQVEYATYKIQEWEGQRNGIENHPTHPSNYS